MNGPNICRVSVEFSQEGNTMGTTEEYEGIEVSLEFQGTEQDGPFYVIKTNGWSFDSLDEIKKLIERTNGVL